MRHNLLERGIKSEGVVPPPKKMRHFKLLTISIIKLVLIFIHKAVSQEIKDK